MGIRDRNISRSGGLSPRYIRWRVMAKTADYVITEDDMGTLFTNRGAAGLVMFTLPVPHAGLAGAVIRLLAVASQATGFASAAADTLLTFNDAAADDVVLQTASEIIGGTLEAVCDGTQWCILPMTYPAQTITIDT